MSQVDHTKAPHPGKVLKEEYMDPKGMSSRMLARELDMHHARINDIVSQRRSITADTALRFAELFGDTPEYWLHMQVAYDLAQAKNKRMLKSSINRKN